MSSQTPLKSTPIRSTQLSLLLRFGLVGLSGVGVNLGALALMSTLGLVSTLASALAIELSIVSNFVFNDRWTFSDRRAGGLWTRAVRFQLVSLIGALMQWGTFVLLGLIFALCEQSEGGWSAYLPIWEREGVSGLVSSPPALGAWQYVAQLIGIAVATSWNFLVNLSWTWGARPHSSEP